MTESPEGPLAGLDQAEAQIIYGNGPRSHRAEDAAIGAVLGGVAGAWLGKHLGQQRQAQPAEEAAPPEPPFVADGVQPEAGEHSGGGPMSGL